MPRPQKERKIMGPPIFRGFKPKGIPARFLENVQLTLDEYESIRLADYEGLEHAEAAEKMGISRSVFTRLVDKARKKVARALVEGCELNFERGHVVFQQERYRCLDCYSNFQAEEGVYKCLKCGSENIEHLNAFYPRHGCGHGHGRRGL